MKPFQQGKTFIGYLTAGQRGLDFTEKAAIALSEGGVDILEIGVPFSDPMADGPVIQAAMTDALTRETTLESTLACVTKIKKIINIPIVLFSYFNPILAMGLESALAAMKQARVDAVLIVDLPMEESKDYTMLCENHGLKTIGLLSPSTPSERIKQISQTTSGFLYYVCRNGTTGVKYALPEDYAQQLQRLRSQTNLPLVSGFGIGDRSLAKQALDAADGFVVGSAFIKAISQGASSADLTQLARDIDPRGEKR